MTITEILEQAKMLTPEERKELSKRLIEMLDSMDLPSRSKSTSIEAHWGRSLNQLLDDIEPITMKYPEIDDPVAWVKHLRAEGRKRRLTDGDDDE